MMYGGTTEAASQRYSNKLGHLPTPTAAFPQVHEMAPEETRGEGELLPLHSVTGSRHHWGRRGDADVLERVGGLASQFAAERAARQSRRQLDRSDFDRLRATGFPLIELPVEQGGRWDGPARSVRFACIVVAVN